MRPHVLLPTLLLMFLPMSFDCKLSAQEAQFFHTPYRLQTDAGFGEVSAGYACPTLYDINRDGAPDLVAGEFDRGQVRVFLNLNQPGEAVFASHEYLMIGRDRFTVPMG